MKGKTKRTSKKAAWTKIRLRLPDLDQAKAAVLNSLQSPESQRGYEHSINEFIAWYCSEPRLSLNKAVVTRYRMPLDRQSLFVGYALSKSVCELLQWKRPTTNSRRSVAGKRCLDCSDLVYSICPQPENSISHAAAASTQQRVRLEDFHNLPSPGAAGFARFR